MTFVKVNNSVPTEEVGWQVCIRRDGLLYPLHLWHCCRGAKFEDALLTAKPIPAFPWPVIAELAARIQSELLVNGKIRADSNDICIPAFHCFVNKKDAISYYLEFINEITDMETYTGHWESRLVIKKVYMSGIVAKGEDRERRPIILTKHIYIPSLANQKRAGGAVSSKRPIAITKGEQNALL